jgi:hypothetical protein
LISAPKRRRRSASALRSWKDNGINISIEEQKEDH